MRKSPFVSLGPFLTPFLVCHTPRAFLYLCSPYQPVNGGFTDTECLSAGLIDGRTGGKAFLNANNIADIPLATACELIAVSTLYSLLNALDQFVVIHARMKIRLKRWSRSTLRKKSSSLKFVTCFGSNGWTASLIIRRYGTNNPWNG
jgi:hypothetical protein